MYDNSLMKHSPKAVYCLESPIGPITLIAQGEKLISVELNKRTKPLGSSAVLAKTAKQLNDYFQGRLARFEIPTQTFGTEFQKAVWKEIAKIGFGKSLSYGDIARKIGQPFAARAVGAAVGANPIPLVVGCHRVLGTTGKITGYSGGKGLPTKVWLLRHEGIDFIK